MTVSGQPNEDHASRTAPTPTTRSCSTGSPGRRRHRRPRGEPRAQRHRDAQPPRAGGPHEVTAISFHAYPYVADRYALMPCGGSFGDGYGPMLVAREPRAREADPRLTIAVPGTLDRGLPGAALSRPAPRASCRSTGSSTRCARAAPRPGSSSTRASSPTAAGAREARRPRRVVEQETGLPLPLGGNAVRRDLGPRADGAAHPARARDGAHSLAHRPRRSSTR